MTQCEKRYLRGIKRDMLSICKYVDEKGIETFENIYYKLLRLEFDKER